MLYALLLGSSRRRRGVFYGLDSRASANEPNCQRFRAIARRYSPNLEKLEAGNYIERLAAAGHAYNYRVYLLLE